jgi:hypothetical protein
MILGAKMTIELIIIMMFYIIIPAFYACFYSFYDRKRNINSIINELVCNLKFINKEIENNSSNLTYFKVLQTKHTKLVKKLNQAKIDKINYER